MKFKLKYGLGCLAMTAMLGIATTSCGEAEKQIPDLEYAYTPATMTVTCESLYQYAYVSGSTANGTMSKYVFPATSGGTVELKALMTPYNVTFPEIIWLTANEDVATVSYPDEGVATVQGTDGVTNSCIVSVTGSVGSTVDITARPPMAVSGLLNVQTATTIRVVSSVTRTSSIALSSGDETLEVGETLTVTATASPSNAIYGNEVTWSTSDSDVATVSAGVIKAVDAGTATITATSLDGSANGTAVSASITVSVVAATI